MQHRCTRLSNSRSRESGSHVKAQLRAHRHKPTPRHACSPSAVPTSQLSSSLPLVEECSIDNWRSPLRCDVEVMDSQGCCGIVVALGKFDAMHIGHRSLAVKACEGGGLPFLLSFWGMAEVLGLPVRMPLVATCDRPRVLQSWASHCSNKVPRQRMIPFHEIRTLSPEAFVELLANNLRAAGVVAGSNYRFGFKAKGTADTLAELGARYGMTVSIVDLVASAPPAVSLVTSFSSDTLDDAAGSGTDAEEDAAAAARARSPAPGETELGPHVSSSKVRQLLSQGAVQDVAPLLGRPYRLVAALPPPEYGPMGSASASRSQDGPAAASTSQAGASASLWSQKGSHTLLPASTMLNQPPAYGRYRCALAVVQRTSTAGGSGLGFRAQFQQGLEPLELPSMLPWQGNSSNGSTAQGSTSSGTGHTSSNGMQPTTDSQSSTQSAQWLRHCVMCDVQLGPDGMAFGLESGVLQALQALGSTPSYVVLDFERSLPLL